MQLMITFEGVLNCGLKTTSASWIKPVRPVLEESKPAPEVLGLANKILILQSLSVSNFILLANRPPIQTVFIPSLNPS